MTALTGQVALVTGAAQGLGRAFAERLRAEGCEIVACDRREAVNEVDGLTYVGDVRDPATVRMVVDGAVAKHGRIDILVNNAGVVKPTGPADDWQKGLDDYDEIVDTNLRGSFLFGRAVATVMREHDGGNIVNIGTDHVFPLPGVDVHGHGAMDLYNASKWAINGLTLDWAISLKEDGIRVNAIHMGATDSEMLRTWMGDAITDEIVGSWMSPNQTAEILVQLLTEGPDGRTGQNIGLWVGREPSISDSTHAGARLSA
jgi:3-oxoacyl-[acyl-carrier protein] reductase